MLTVPSWLLIPIDRSTFALLMSFSNAPLTTVASFAPQPVSAMAAPHSIPTSARVLIPIRATRPPRSEHVELVAVEGRRAGPHAGEGADELEEVLPAQLVDVGERGLLALGRERALVEDQPVEEAVQ